MLRELSFCLLVGACVGCPPPAQVPQVVTASDGGAVVVNVPNACANLATQCGADAASCTSALQSLQGMGATDLPCMVQAPSKAAAAACAGAKSLCR